MTTTPKTSARPLRILIADDHDVMREGTRAVIERPIVMKVAER